MLIRHSILGVRSGCRIRCPVVLRKERVCMSSRWCARAAAIVGLSVAALPFVTGAAGAATLPGQNEVAVSNVAGNENKTSISNVLASLNSIHATNAHADGNTT